MPINKSAITAIASRVKSASEYEDSTAFSEDMDALDKHMTQVTGILKKTEFMGTCRSLDSNFGTHKGSSVKLGTELIAKAKELQAALDKFNDLVDTIDE